MTELTKIRRPCIHARNRSSLIAGGVAPPSTNNFVQTPSLLGIHHLDRLFVSRSHARG
jgi:hypothetical protein